MDDPGLSAERFLGSLRGLRRVNQLTGNASLGRLLLKEAGRHTGSTPLKVLDVACGAGDLLIRLSERFRNLGLDVDLQGCDLNPLAVEYATEQARRSSVQVHFFRLDALADPLPDDRDIIMSSLFLHHLDHEQAQTFLRKLARTTRHQVLIHDLVRSRAGYLLAFLGVRTLLCNDVCRHDGPASVEAAFTIPEVFDLAQSAGLSGCLVKPRFPCRFLLEWSRQ